MYDPVSVNLSKKFHPSQNLNYELVSNLKDSIKKKTIIKLFPSKESLFTEKIWLSRFGKKTKIISSSSQKSIDYFKKAKMVILDDISTAFYELLYLNLPFIIILENLDEFKEKFKKKLIKLKNLNILFSDPKKAALF